MHTADRELTERLWWLCRLRWLASVGIGLGALGGRYVLGFPLPLAGLLTLGAVVAMYNFLLLLGMRAALPPERVLPRSVGSLFAHLQIALDLFALTGVLHYTGGLESPLAPYLVFHMIIASTLLTPLAAAAEATLASALYAALVLGEARGLLPHHPLGLFGPETYTSRFIYLLPLALVSVLYVSVYLAGSIVQRLRQRERELSLLTERLEEARRRAEDAYRQVEQAQNMQLRYMYRVSHELRGPLAAAASLLNALAAGPGAPSPDGPTAEVLARVSARLRQALDMVADLLLLSRAREAPREEQRGWIDLTTLLAQVADRLADRAADAHLTLTLAPDPELAPLWGQREALEVALTNLVGNAIKYSEPGGTVTVSARQDATATELVVTDTGIGIAPEDQPRIFQEFFRTQAARNLVAEGTGLGLSIVQSIAEAHGGVCTVESRPGAGSTFTLRLPHQYPELEG